MIKIIYYNTQRPKFLCFFGKLVSVCQTHYTYDRILLDFVFVMKQLL